MKGSNVQDGEDGDKAGGSGREGKRQDVALPRAQGSSVSLAQIWTSPLWSPLNERCASRLIKGTPSPPLKR